MNETFLVRYPKTKIRLRTLLVFPNRYELGIAGLGFQSVYHQLMMHPAVSCEWGFPDETGRLHCLESSSGLKDFDAVFFSFSFEPDLLNIVRILDLEGWNFEEAKRMLSVHRHRRDSQRIHWSIFKTDGGYCRFG